MMKLLNILGCLILVIIPVNSCGFIEKKQKESAQEFNPFDGIPYVLNELRNNSKFTDFQDSIAQIVIGTGAKTLDNVKHNVMWNDRQFVINTDWGGVLELPVDWIPEEDQTQGITFYHGSHVFSPDSTMVIGYYAGASFAFDYDSPEECMESLIEFCQDSVTEVLSAQLQSVMFGDSTCMGCVIRTRTSDGRIGYSRDIFSSPDGIEYSVKLQYEEGHEAGVKELIEMIDRYPFGPDGQQPYHIW